MTMASLPRVRVPGPRRDAEIATRLRKVSGQLAGVTVMHENGRYCLDVLDQLAAVAAAVDAVALLVVEDHVRTCVRHAIESGEAEDEVAELLAAVRRYVRSR